MPGANPEKDRIVRAATTFVAIPEASAAPAVARELVDAGATIVEDGADPVAGRTEVTHAGARTHFVPVPTAADAAAAAAAIADEVQLIELYDGIGPAAAALVVEAVGARIPVGSVLYGR